VTLGWFDFPHAFERGCTKAVSLRGTAFDEHAQFGVVSSRGHAKAIPGVSEAGQVIRASRTLVGLVNLSLSREGFPSQTVNREGPGSVDVP